MERIRMAACVAVVALLLTSCGQVVVTETAPQAPPYDGPLAVEITAAPTDEDADRSGAAGLVVDCDHPHVGSTEGSPFAGEVSRSAVAALEKELREAPRGATSGFHEVRSETDRVLYTYEVDGRVRIAYVIRRGPTVDHHTGWYAESWARCDWAELPPSAAEALGLQLWTGPDGLRAPTTSVVSEAGPEHCDWQAMTFLSLDGGSLDGGRSFVAHPDPAYYPDYVTVPYAEGRPLPADARDTGYAREGRHLWVAPDDSRAYVGTPDAVDVWPAEVQPLGCA